MHHGQLSTCFLTVQEGSVQEATFTKFNDQAEELVAQGVRWVWRGQGFPDPSAFPEQTFAKDIEPEYIAVSKVRCATPAPATDSTSRSEAHENPTACNCTASMCWAQQGVTEASTQHVP